MPDRSRIPPKPVHFSTYIISTDKRQLSIDEDTSNPRWKLWQWTADESEQWSKFRQRCGELYTIYSNKSFKNRSVKNKMLALIKETRRYDGGKGAGRHLLEKVAIYGNIEDWSIFRIKRGTSLQKKHTRSNGDPGSHRPVIIIRETTKGAHRLSVRNAANTRSRAMPEGIIWVQVYRYVGTTPPQRLQDYEQIGVAKRGIFISRLDHLKLDKEKKYYAWYIARYRHRLGKLGLPSDVAQAIVYDY